MGKDEGKMIQIKQEHNNTIEVRGFVNGCVNIIQHHAYCADSDFVVVEKSSITVLIDALKKEMEK